MRRYRGLRRAAGLLYGCAMSTPAGNRDRQRRSQVADALHLPDDAIGLRLTLGNKRNPDHAAGTAARRRIRLSVPVLSGGAGRNSGQAFLKKISWVT